MELRRSMAAVGLAAAVSMPIAWFTSGAGAAPGRGPRPVEVQIVAINDFHGVLEASSGLVIDPATGNTGTNPTTNPNAVPAGGAEYLASHIRALDAQSRNTTVVSAGDL